MATLWWSGAVLWWLSNLEHVGLLQDSCICLAEQAAERLRPPEFTERIKKRSVVWRGIGRVMLQAHEMLREFVAQTNLRGRPPQLATCRQYSNILARAYQELFDHILPAIPASKTGWNWISSYPASAVLGIPADGAYVRTQFWAAALSFTARACRAGIKKTNQTWNWALGKSSKKVVILSAILHCLLGKNTNPHVNPYIHPRMMVLNMKRDWTVQRLPHSGRPPCLKGPCVCNPIFPNMIEIFPKGNPGFSLYWVGPQSVLIAVSQ